MPVIKHYECTRSLNTLKLEIDTDCNELFLTIKDDGNHITNIFLTRNDLIHLIDELEEINEDLFDNEKGGSNE